MSMGQKTAVREQDKFLPSLDASGATAVILALCAILYFAFLGSRALWDPGEGRYALISRGMLQSHDWLVPRLNGVLYFEKPPLAYWLNAFAMKLFGFTEVAARLFTALSGFLSVVFTCWFTAKIFDKRTAALAGAILFTSLGFFAWAQISELDMLFTLLLCSGMGFIYLAFENLCERKCLYAHIGYALLGLACLVKGPVAFALPLLIIIPYLVFTGAWRRLKDLYSVTGILLALVVCAPWFAAISLREKDFAGFFFIHENFQRYSSTVHHRTGQLWYFIPVLAGAMFPWVCALPAVFAGLRRSVTSWREGEGRHVLFLLLWAGMIFLFFSCSGSKRPPYILPVLIPLAIVTARYFSLRWNDGEGLLSFALPCLVLNVIVAAALAVAPGHLKALGPEFSLHWFLPALFLSASGALAVYFARRKAAAKAWTSVFCGALLFSVTLYWQAAKFDEMFSRKAISSIIMAEFKTGDRLLAFDADYERNFQSMGYYTGQRVAITGSKGELEFGAAHDPLGAEYFPDQAAALRLLESDTRIFMILQKGTLELLAPLVKASLYRGPQVAGRLEVVSNKPWSSTRVK